MGQYRFNRDFLIAAAVFITVILYLSLYPFRFREPVDSIGAVRTLLGSWANAPSRADFLENVAFYMPLGFFAVLAISGDVGTRKRASVAIVIGAVLSTSMELAQYYIDGRVTEATDVYANVAGTALGAVGGCVMGRGFRWPLTREIAANHVPALLLTVWVGYRLFPYYPLLSLHRSWEAIKPAVVHPTLTAYDLFRYTAIWLTITTLIEAIGGLKRLWLLFPIFAGSVFLAEVLIAYRALSMAEIAGAALAVCAWLVLAESARLRATLVTLLFLTYLIVERLEPFQFSATVSHFGWIPFLGFKYIPIKVGAASFLEKIFLYGSSVWFLSKIGLGIRSSTMIVAIVLFATSWAETHLPGRSAEITDAVMALVIGGVISLIETRKPPVVGTHDVHARMLDP